MDIMKVIEANDLIDQLDNAELALANLPGDAVLLAFLKDNPEDLRIGVRFPGSPEDIKSMLDANPGMPDDVAGSLVFRNVSCGVPEDLWLETIALLRSSLQIRINTLELQLSALGVEMGSKRRQADAAAVGGRATH